MITAPEARLRLRVHPRASRDEVTAWQDDVLRVRVTAPPVDGDANAAVRTLVARTLRVAPSTVEIVRGERSRDKIVRVVGLSLADVRARLAAVVAAALLVASFAAPAMAEHLTLDPGARPSPSGPLDSGLNVRVERDGFDLSGRLSGFGHSFGGWLRGRVRERGVTIDGGVDGKQSYNFHLDAETERGLPRLRIETYPGTL